MKVALVYGIAVRTAPDLIKCLSSHHGSKLCSSLPWHFLFILKLLLHLHQNSDFRRTVNYIQILYKFAPKSWIQSVQPMQKLITMNVLSAMKRCKHTVEKWSQI
ncbi:PREDICTED: uncharacterized protein LOC106803317 isoform X1 [Ceratotherium simum simum]|uniref:Uncharacterized protein LOC106803317 isoform X1 n=1 Tax=Ceratotherium simum simum TaxID=73337 RepID=A0ABM1DDM3_CERSS|nr:PREDICTED: uncharacterized protein LOC106803317 isoform X1 [Ceratotherium simum simum]